MVAEKPSLAQSIAKILSNGNMTTRRAPMVLVQCMNTELDLITSTMLHPLR